MVEPAPAVLRNKPALAIGPPPFAAVELSAAQSNVPPGAFDNTPPGRKLRVPPLQVPDPALTSVRPLKVLIAEVESVITPPLAMVAAPEPLSVPDTQLN